MVAYFSPDQHLGFVYALILSGLPLDQQHLIFIYTPTPLELLSRPTTLYFPSKQQHFFFLNTLLLPSNASPDKQSHIFLLTSDILSFSIMPLMFPLQTNNISLSSTPSNALQTPLHHQCIMSTPDQQPLIFDSTLLLQVHLQTSSILSSTAPSYL